MHGDVYCAAADRDAECRRVLELGATHVRDSDDPDDAFVVFADPEGNRFCVCPIGCAWANGVGIASLRTSDRPSDPFELGGGAVSQERDRRD